MFTSVSIIHGRKCSAIFDPNSVLVTIASTGEHSQVLSRKESQVGANLSHRHQVWEEWGEIEEEEKEEGCQ